MTLFESKILLPAPLLRLFQAFKNAKPFCSLLPMMETDSLSLEEEIRLLWLVILYIISVRSSDYNQVEIDISLCFSVQSPGHDISRLLNPDNILRIILFGPKEQRTNC